MFARMVMAVVLGLVIFEYCKIAAAVLWMWLF